MEALPLRIRRLRDRVALLVGLSEGMLEAGVEGPSRGMRVPLVVDRVEGRETSGVVVAGEEEGQDLREQDRQKIGANQKEMGRSPGA